MITKPALPPNTPPEAGANRGRRERKRRQTADHLATTAFRLFETQGYEAVTMEQIAVEADVAKGTLYSYFPLKEALLAHQFHQELADHLVPLQTAMDAPSGFAARMTVLLDASADWSETRRAYLLYYLRFRLTHTECGEKGEDDAPHLSSGLDRVFEALIRAGQSTGELRTHLPPDQLARMFQFLYLGALTRWLTRPNHDLRQALNAALDLFLHGLIAPAAQERS
ncbi:MAG: TetR/AcrR family transcriptional regulator [Candidatus Competibacteraceae bacterium]|nr:TetR/AcrR family transcriptional regulator [Candidatus Competibacteraceae bacterium]